MTSTTEHLEELAKMVEAARSGLDYTWEQLAVECGVSRKHLGRLRKKEVPDPHPETVKAINRAYRKAKDKREGVDNPVNKRREELASLIAHHLSDDAIMDLYPELMQYHAADMAARWGTSGGRLKAALEGQQPIPEAVAMRGEFDED